MRYLNKTDHQITAAYVASLAPDHVERVIFDRSLEELLPSHCVGPYADAAEAMKKALASVFEFRELVREDAERREAERREISEALTRSLGSPAPAPAPISDDEIPF